MPEVAVLENWAIAELQDRASRRCFGLIEYEDTSTGKMIPGMYVVYSWSGPNLHEMRLGGGQALFHDIEDALVFCENRDYIEVTENMKPEGNSRHQRWTISYIPFLSK